VVQAMHEPFQQLSTVCNDRHALAGPLPLTLQARPFQQQPFLVHGVHFWTMLHLLLPASGPLRPSLWANNPDSAVTKPPLPALAEHIHHR
jgi:hypothetical protein